MSYHDDMKAGAKRYILTPAEENLIAGLNAGGAGDVVVLKVGELPPAFATWGRVPAPEK